LIRIIYVEFDLKKELIKWADYRKKKEAFFVIFARVQQTMSYISNKGLEELHAGNSRDIVTRAYFQHFDEKKLASSFYGGTGHWYIDIIDRFANPSHNRRSK